MVDLENIETAMAADDEAAVTTLFQRAMVPGEDNISIIVACIEPADAPPNGWREDIDGREDAH
jgi:hypothetical protein